MGCCGSAEKPPPKRTEPTNQQQQQQQKPPPPPAAPMPDPVVVPSVHCSDYYPGFEGVVVCDGSCGCDKKENNTTDEDYAPPVQVWGDGRLYAASSSSICHAARHAGITSERFRITAEKRTSSSALKGVVGANGVQSESILGADVVDLVSISAV